MCSEKEKEESHLDAIAVNAVHLSKIYSVYGKPLDRLKQFFWRNKRQYYSTFVALDDVNITLKKGEILGIIGQNGAGKSTLLQLICSTLTPSSGHVKVNGRIAALLELGAGFNPEFTGRENVYLNAAILGLSEEEINRKFDDIVEFSGIGGYIDQPIKTYSSGMYVRLAFSVAVSVEPDILIIDEALSVGDGAFSRKSFDRIMQLKDQGKTILFCSHSMYQIEVLCNQALWLDAGRVKKYGAPEKVVAAYNHFLEQKDAIPIEKQNTEPGDVGTTSGQVNKITKVQVMIDGNSHGSLVATSKVSTLSIKVQFISSILLLPPSVAVAICGADGKMITSASTHNDKVNLNCDKQGKGQAVIIFPKLSLLKGKYTIDVFLACENALHLYEQAKSVASFEVVQIGLEQGVVALSHEWRP